MRAGGFVIGLVVSMLPLLSASCQKEGPDGGGDSDPADEIVEYETLQAKSPQRGVSFNFAQLADYDFPLLGDAVSWYYDWSSVVPSETVDSYMEQYGIEVHLELLRSVEPVAGRGLIQRRQVKVTARKQRSAAERRCY